MPSLTQLLEGESTTIDLEPGDFERLLRRRDRRARNQRIRAGALAIIVVVVTVVALARALDSKDRTADDLTPAPVLRRNGEVLRVSNALQTQDPTTGEVRTLAERFGGDGLFGSRTVERAAWSADGRWAAFEIRGCDGEAAVPTSGLWVTNGIGEPRHLKARPCLGDDDRNFGPEQWEWSPADARLVVADRTVGGDVLLLIDPASGDRTSLGEARGEVTSVAWSPDGTLIAYGAVTPGTEDPYLPRHGSVHSVSLSDGGHSRLASSVGLVSGGETGAGIRWSPDGTRIAVLTEAGRGTRLYLMNADGSDLDLFTEKVVIEHILGSPNLEWSPNGTRFAYATYPGERGKGLQVWNGSADGSLPILVYESPPGPISGLAGGPVWSPDGTRIAFRYSPTQQEDGWLIVNADGTGGVTEIDELQYLSWRGGWYFCECYG